MLPPTTVPNERRRRKPTAVNHGREPTSSSKPSGPNPPAAPLVSLPRSYLSGIADVKHAARLKSLLRGTLVRMPGN